MNKEQILKLNKWDDEYKKIYQKLYYKMKTEQITALEYDIFLNMKNKPTKIRKVYNRKTSAEDTFKKDKLFLPTFKKLEKPILITFD
tara:strand:- start:708 stop:968 length:261 start_codon:yes stop_codon:yes gene_type:complete